MQYFAILFFALLIESLMEVIKGAFPFKVPQWAIFVITSIFGVFVCLSYNVDIMGIFGYEPVSAFPSMGFIITGLIVGAGSSFVHKLLDTLTSVKNANNTYSSNPVSVPAPNETDETPAP